MSPNLDLREPFGTREWLHAGPSGGNDFIVRTDAVVRIQLCRRMQLRTVTGGRRRKACVNKTK